MPLLSPLLDSDRETRLPLPTVSDRLAVLDTPTPPLLAASVRVLTVDSEMAATVVSPDTVARRPTVPTTENTVTRPPVEPPLLAVPSAVVASALPATPSAVVVPLTTLASAVPVSDVDSPTAAPTSDALVAVPPVATTTVMHTLVPVVPLVAVASLLATTSVPSTVLRVPHPRDTVARRATVATPDSALPAATVETVDPLSPPVDTVVLTTV